MSTHAAIIVAAVLGTACVATETADVEEPGLALADSAGIEIVTISYPRPHRPLGWTLSADPRVVIGANPDVPAHVLYRVAGATRMADGRIAVLDSHAAELRLYAADGEYLRALGGRGNGPGEFRRPQHLLRSSGDTLVVWDSGLGPITFFDRGGAFVRQHRIDLARVVNLIGLEHATERLMPLADGSFVLYLTVRSQFLSAPERGRFVRFPLGFLRVNQDLTAVNTLGWYGGLPVAVVGDGGRPSHALALFPYEASIAAGGRPLRIYAGDGSTYDVRVFDEHGVLRRIVRLNVPRVTIPDADFKQARNRRLAAGEEAGLREVFERELAELPEEVHYPAFRAMIVDADGYLWLQSPGVGWQVLDPNGRWLGTLDLPFVRIFEIGRDYILGLQLDRFQVETVVLHSLQRHQAG